MNMSIKGFLFCTFILIVYMTPISAISKDESILGSNEIRMINSSIESERIEGKNLVLKEREQSIESLISIVNEPVVSGEPFYIAGTPRNIAIYLLGHMRAEEAVPSLLNWIVPQEGQSSVRLEITILNPASISLVEIGLPAINPLLLELKNEGLMTPLGRQCLMTIISILGPEVTEFRLKKEIDSEPDDNVKKKLTSCLEAIEGKEIPIDKLWDSAW